jgi:hypothetical protein
MRFHRRGDDENLRGRPTCLRESVKEIDPKRLWRPSAHTIVERSSERDRPDILKQREAWFENQLGLDPERLVFIDETWATTNMARKKGRARKGARPKVRGCAPALPTVIGKRRPSLPAFVSRD